MNILHLIPYMHPVAGGPPVVVDRFARELVRRGHDVTVMSTNALAPSDGLDWRAAYEGGYRLEIFHSYRRKGFGYSPPLRSALAASVRQFDIVHLHNLWGYTTLAGTSACLKHDVPFVVSSHGMLDPNSLSRKSLKKSVYGRFVEFPRLRRANAMIYTHPEEERLANQSCPMLPPGYVVPLGADEPPREGIQEARSQILERHRELAGKRLVLFFGRIHPKKGVDVLIPGFAQLQQRLPDAHLVLAGPFAPGYEETVRSLIRQHGVERTVTFMGSVSGPTKWAILTLSELFVLPSYQENFAITVVEALRMGVPVILSDHVNIVNDIVDAGAGLRTGLNPASLANAMARMLTNDSERAQFAANGPRLVEERFNWGVATDALLDSYNSVLGKESSSNAANAPTAKACIV